MRRVVFPLLAVIVALHVLAQPIAAIASAGWREDARCCCPDPVDCRCPHGDHGNGDDMLRRCGNAGDVIAPTLCKEMVAVAVIDPIAPAAMQSGVPVCTDEDPEERWSEPETPPF